MMKPPGVQQERVAVLRHSDASAVDCLQSNAMRSEGPRAILASRGVEMG